MKQIVTFLGSIALIALVVILFTFPTKWLWNYVMPYLFQLRTIDVWHALGLNALAGILFRTTVKTKGKK